ncbi:MAG: orotate phosphoribosyltransferase [Alphaproteobacteria bacterium]|jgi:orotate phosphoribosyltransferase|nr:orotate phosphoribosyltransferase [Pelagibacterales bacterium]PCH49105.1 MAG: orotate phosphoribosyltransferase [Pelagibacteraceae bacterium]RUA14004.1 MAG: orotate phosphoribosyltransferase [Alphaproteobacteria bacterium]RUA17916.1 MAG: orotate phosphoribosyltransferase [Alphaproteobacteria bacterium]
MLSYNESLKILKETNALLEGHFILSSGLHSNQYVQCAKLLSYPKQAEIICAALTEKIKSNFNKIDIVLSPALGGIVVGYEIGKQLNTQTIFAERSNNKLVLRRGFAIPQDSNVLIVEDVITTGKSAIECSEIVKINKANLIGFACVIDRSDNNVLIKEKIVSQIKIKIAIFKENELPDELKKTPAVKPGSRNLSNDQN